MNTDALFTFSKIQKEIPQPANDLAFKQKTVARKESDVDSVNERSNALRTKENQKNKSFDDYINDSKDERSRHTSSANAQSTPEPSRFSQLLDLRSLLAGLLEGLKDDAGEAGLDALADGESPAQSPEDILLSFLSDEQAASEPQNGEGEAGLFFTKASLKLDEAQESGLGALSAFLNLPGLTAIDGITPEVLTQLQQDVESALSEERSFDELAALNDIATRIADLAKPKDESGQPAAAQTVTPDTGHKKADKFETRYEFGNFAAGSEAEADGAEYDFKSALRTAQAVHTPPSSGDHVTKGSSGVKPALLFMLPEGLNLLAPGATDGQAGLATAAPIGGAAASTPSLSGPNLINPALHAPSAAQPHPAVQTVAATLQKFGAEKQDTRITLQLDPPELGRVEVKMSLNKDNAAKVVLTIEKPETFAMLQRDAHVLERALLDAGLSPDGSGLEFSLADDGYSFSGDGGQDGHGGNGRFAGQNEGDEKTILIAGQMGWSVNPHTGRMQYDVLV